MHGNSHNHLRTLDGIEPCMLPIRSHTTRKPLEEGNIFKTELHPCVGHVDWMNEGNFTNTAFFKAVCSLVLGCYTGLSNVCFAIIESNLLQEPSAGTDKPTLSLQQTTIDTASTLHDLLLGIYVKSKPTIRGDYSPDWNTELQAVCNTLVVLGKPFVGAETDKLLATWALVIHVFPEDVNAPVRMCFASDMISQQQARKILETTRTVISRITENPMQSVGVAYKPTLKDIDNIRQWNPTPVEQCWLMIHQLVEHSISLNPEGQAICAWDGDASYSELGQMSSVLMVALQTHGVSGNSSVVICIDKSKWFVVVMLAVLKAGGVCVPVSPTCPQQRIESIIELTGAKIIILNPNAHPTFEISEFEHAYKSSCVSIMTKRNECEPDAFRPVTIESPAFIMFTSGSTGEPKGVIKDHLSITMSVIGHGKAFSVDSTSCVFQFAAHIWAISIYDFFSTLAHGGCICIPSENDRINRLDQTMRKFGITHATLAPSVVSNVITPDQVPSLRVLILGGEPILRANMEDWSESTRLFSNYGTTETLCAANIELNNSSSSSTAGLPTRVNRCWITHPDDPNRLMPAGGVGELLVEGFTVATGYLKDETKSRESFIKAPIWFREVTNVLGSGTDSVRFYRTGDLARYLDDGIIQIMGRKDTQVKVRGQRVELGEVEYNLNRCVGPPTETVAGLLSNNKLAAFIRMTNKEDASQLLKELESQLFSALPRYMIPSVFYTIPDIPRTASGKLDRRQLKVWVDDGFLGEPISFPNGLEGELGRPLSEIETVLARCWNWVLGLGAISLTHADNFFRRGGDSVDAIQLVDTLRGEGFELTVQNIFQNPSLGDMATAMQQKELLYDHDEYIKLSLLPNDQVSRIVHNICQKYNIPTSAIEDIYPCTALQIGLMTLSQTQPGAYVAHHEFEMAVRVTTQDFQDAWRQLVSETPTLRTRIVEVDDASFYQVVLRSGHVVTHEEHVTQAMSIDEPTTQLLPTFGDQLVHSTIICPEGSRRWLWTVHHAIYDGWSVDLILRRLNELLAASPHEIVNRPVPKFASYVRYLQGLDSLSSQKYWDVELAGYDGQIFPFHIPRSYRPQSNSSAQRQVPLPMENTGFTVASFIKAAWGLLLSTYTGDQDVTFGTTVTGRSAPVAGIRDIVGPTIATVPIRLNIDSAQSVYDFLCTVQRQSTQMIPHEHFGLQRIRLLNEGAERACGFQNLLITQPGPSQDSGKTIKEITVHTNNYLTYALTIECFLNQNTVDIVATFDESVIESRQIKRLLGQLAHIVTQLIQATVSKDGSLVRDIQSLSPEDVADITAWNSKRVTRINLCLHQLIEQRALEFPLSVAVDAWDGSLSYHDLREQSTQLAQELVQHGVGPEIFVPICCQKSKWVVVCILAVMKAGGAFVLLDISHPVERLQHIVQSVHAEMVLCSPEQMELGSELGLQTINCRSLSINFPPTSQVHLPDSVSPQNALYATFTSGSTGNPKGIIIEHWQCVSGFIAQLQVGLFTSQSRVLQFASFGFDSAIEQILATILAGGCVCIPQEEGRLQNLTDFIRMFRVNLADLTPSVATLLNPEEVPSLEVLRLSGETVGESLPLLWAGHARVENSYGPSECCVTSLTNQDLVAAADSYNIGRAICCQAWVVDPEDCKKLIAIGAIGELVIQGPIVARGYIEAVGKSSTAFFESPTWFQDDQLRGVDRTDRCYRTGDLVRYATDGTITFIGRKDNQVKLRGQRIELEEIEHQILRHSEVAGAHITMPSKGPYANELVALVQHNNFAGHHVLGLSNLEFSDPGDADMLVTLMNNLKKFLTSSLPHFMIPTEWVPVNSLPLTASGKTNRRAATAWLEDISDTALDTIRIFSAAGATSGVSDTTGTTVLELIRIIADVVGGTRSQYKMKYAGDVTLRAAGLDSISVVSLLKALRQHFNVDLVMSSLHWDMTIQGLANIIDGKNSGEASDDPILDLSAEISKLQVEFGIAKWPTPNACRSIFLTGATGYLGTQILRALLESDPVSLVIVLIRDWDVKAATERLIIAAKKARWWCDAHLSRIEVWLGDLSKPRFELLPSHWERLMGTSITSNVDAIIHNGAIVNWFGSYQALKPANTNSTAQLLQALQSSYALQRLVYVSGGPQWDPNKIKPDDDDTLIARLNATNGYGKTKLISEKLLEMARSTRVSIIKPGFVIGTEAEGVPNTDDFVWRITAGCVAIGAFSMDEAESWMFVCGSDVFSKVVIDHLHSHEKTDPVKLLYGLTVKEFWACVSEVTNQKLIPLPHNEWRSKLIENVSMVGTRHPCWSILYMAQEATILGAIRPIQTPSEQIRTIEAVKNNIQYLVDIDYFSLSDSSSCPNSADIFHRNKVS